MPASKMEFNIEAAIEFFYSRHEISSKDIMRIFGCSRSKADKFRRQVRDYEAANGDKMLVYDVHNVQVDYAYMVWGIDVPKLEKKIQDRYKYHKSIGRSA